MNDYLTKPVQKSDLLDMIAKWGRILKWLKSTPLVSAFVNRTLP